MSSEITIKLKTLTPLWTGGVDATCERIHETGILGSLRWWHEVIVRGLGGKACDPSKHECRFDVEKYRKSKAADERLRLRDAGLCDVCQVFGATGWRRRFRLEVMEDATKPAWTPADKMLNIRPPDRSRGWFLPPGRMGTVALRVEGDEEVISLLAALFLFLGKWGSLGAKPQLGYGVFAIENGEGVTARAEKHTWSVMGSENPRRDLPDLRQFGFFRYPFQPEKSGWWTQVPGIPRVAAQVQPLVSQYQTVPVAPALKNEWRFNRWQRSWGDDREIFGTLRPERKRGRVAVSWAYPLEPGWEIRGWAWLQKPGIAPDVWQMLADAEVWKHVIGVSGRLEVKPEGRWRELSCEEVQEFLEATK